MNTTVYSLPHSATPMKRKKIVELLASRRCGHTRKEIIERTGIGDNGSLTKTLSALAASDFIMKYIPFGKSPRDEHYKLADPFCVFYLKFVKGHNAPGDDFWLTNVTSQSISSWRGYAFEEVCLRHIDQIKCALGISGVSTKQSAWMVKGTEDIEGSQIDLIIERKDGIVNMCEMKFYNDEFTVTKSYERTIVGRYNRLTEMIPKRHIANPVLITTFGLTYNEHFGTFKNVITIDNLFK